MLLAEGESEGGDTGLNNAEDHADHSSIEFCPRVSTGVTRPLSKVFPELRVTLVNRDTCFSYREASGSRHLDTF